MGKIWLIARREYLFNFKRRSFLFSAFGVPIFSLVLMFVIINLAKTTTTQTGQLGQIGYVDKAGILENPVETPEEYIAFPEEEAAHQALLNGEIGAYFVVAPNFMNSAGEVDAYGLDGVPDGIKNQFEEFIQANLARLVPENVAMDRIRDPMNVTVVDAATGNELEGEAAFMGRFMAPFILAFVFLMAVNTTSQFLMSSVVEEKENRMMEILLTSCTPLQMLWGKVLGLGLLGLTQVVLWIGAGALIISGQSEGVSAFLSGVRLTPDIVILGLLYLVLGYFFFSGVMAGVGASVTAEREGQQFAGFFSVLTVLPMALLITFMEDPNGALPVFFSIFPLTSPVGMLMRMPMTTVPTWQIVLSVGLLAVTVFATIWLAARVFRLGLLMYGKRLTVREIIAALRQGRQTIVSAAQAQEGV